MKKSILLFTLLNIKAMSKEINTQIVINATPEKVWTILMDFEKYSTWNPFIKSISGTPMVGKKITAYIHPPEASPMIFKPKVLVLNKNLEFRWIGKLLLKGLFDGEHNFKIIDNKNGTVTFIQSEKFSGILVGLFSKMLDNNTLNGFKLMNEKLKEQAEK
jgi:hypothetical protein